MTNENNDTILKTLEFFKKKGTKVHIRVIAGEDSGLWRNGYIIDVVANKFLMVDDVIGSCQYKFEEIDSNISPYHKQEEKK